jgi:hypothetical protein
VKRHSTFWLTLPAAFVSAERPVALPGAAATSSLGAATCGISREARGPQTGDRLRPVEFVARDPGARVGSDKFDPKFSAWFEPGVYSATEAVDIINADAIGVHARIGADGGVELEET